VKKTQTDLVQAYYRYLYSYNKYFLSQQQVQARKQELDCADSQAEKQRATVDLANTQQEADGSRDDMRSAQADLASVAGASAARTVIKNVSGVTPSLEQIAADSQPQAKDKGGEGGSGGLFKVFGFGKGKSKDDDQSADDAPKVAAENRGKEKKEKEKDKDVKRKRKERETNRRLLPSLMRRLPKLTPVRRRQQLPVLVRQFLADQLALNSKMSKPLHANQFCVSWLKTPVEIILVSMQMQFL